jgi:hypothetical protein
MSDFRVVLRAPSQRDAAVWCALVRVSRRFLAGRASTDARPEAYRTYLALSRAPNAHCRLIWRRADGRLLGAINLTQIVRGRFQSAYLGYYLGAAFAGQGYMREALAPSGRSQHPARQPGFHRTGPPGRLRARGLLTSLPQAGGPLAGSRALGSPD